MAFMGENARNEQFAKVSYWFQDTLNLKPTEALCYALILGFSVRGAWCQFSLSKFAERLNVDRTTASETLKKLDEARSCYKAGNLRAIEFTTATILLGILMLLNLK